MEGLSRLAIPFWLIVVLAGLLWGTEYVRRDLWEPDEARFAYVSGEMRVDGNWLVPRRHAHYYAHKPPLMFWLINGFASLTGTGINRVTARLPSLLGAILSLWATSRLALLWFGRAASWRAVLVLMTSALFWQVSGMGQIDALFCGLQMTALWLLFTADEAPPGHGRRAGAYLLLGLAILTKGPVGLLVPLAVYAAALAASGQARQLRRWHWLWGLGLALVPVAAWLGAIVLTNQAPPGYLKELLLDQNAGRVTGSFAIASGHRRPFWYFLEYFPLDFLPWTIFLPACWLALKRQPLVRARLIKATTWILCVIALFSLSATKRALYILLVYPAAAIIVAAGWDYLHTLGARWRQVPAVLAAGLLLLAGGAGLLAPLLTAHLAVLPLSAWAVVPTGAILAAGGGFLLSRLRAAPLGSAWFMAFWATLALALGSVAAVVYPALNPLKAPYALAAAARQHLPSGQELLLYKMNGEIQALYCHTHGRQCFDREDLITAMRAQGRGLVVIDSNNWAEVSDLAPLRGRDQHYRMGNKRLIWAAFDATAPAPPAGGDDSAPK